MRLRFFKEKDMAKIFVTEDDAALLRELTGLLKSRGYETEACVDFSAAAKEAAAFGADLALMDVGLPGVSGYALGQQIKDAGIPVIFLTSRSTEADELMGITVGDDFVAKPFNAAVLIARICNVLKRSEVAAVKTVNGLTLDSRSLTAEMNGRIAELTRNEVKILACLMDKPGEVVSRTELVDRLWDNELYIDDNTLNVNINRIRDKLRGIGAEDYIRTKRGAGYTI